MLSALEFSSIFEGFLGGGGVGRVSLGLETFPSESHQSNRKTRVSGFFSFPRTLVLLHQSPVGPDHCRASGQENSGSPVFTLCLCSVPRLGFLPSDAPAAQVSDSSYPLTSPHMQIQFLCLNKCLYICLTCM